MKPLVAGLALALLISGCSLNPSPGTMPPREYRLLSEFHWQQPGECIPEGSRVGGWVIRYTGFGCVAGDSAAASLAMRPRAATDPAVTHAALAVGPVLPPSYTLRATFRTPAQTRQGMDPNAWEVAWLVWSYVDDEHFYYFIPKQNGWELGKRDPAYPGGQRFLATGEWEPRSTADWQSVEVRVEPGTMRVSMEGRELVSFTDRERPLNSGRVALYTEDAEIHIREVDLIY